MLQRVTNRPLDGLRGILVVAALAALVPVDSWVAALLGRFAGGAVSAVFFWGFGALVAGVAMWHFVLAYVYALNGSVLRVCRAYGKRERLAEDIYLNNILFSGTPEEVRKRYPNARIRRAVRSECEIEPYAIAYRDGGEISIYILQPDSEIRAALKQAAKSK